MAPTKAMEANTTVAARTAAVSLRGVCVQKNRDHESAGISERAGGCENEITQLSQQVSAVRSLRIGGSATAAQLTQKANQNPRKRPQLL